MSSLGSESHLQPNEIHGIFPGSDTVNKLLLRTIRITLPVRGCRALTLLMAALGVRAGIWRVSAQ